MNVAVGTDLLCPPEARWHGREIPAGYAKVTVDEIVMGFDSMELDIPGPEGERTLGEVLGGIILWDKNNIKLQARRQGQHRLRVIAGHHHLQEAPRL